MSKSGLSNFYENRISHLSVLNIDSIPINQDKHQQPHALELDYLTFLKSLSLSKIVKLRFQLLLVDAIKSNI